VDHFVIFYSDRRTIEDADPFAINKRSGVQVVVQPDAENRWVTISGGDFYMWDRRGGPEQWFPGDYAGLILYLLQPGRKAVLLGEHVDKYRFREILNAATDLLGEKAGYNAGERKPNE
jgi:hypothetical protein